MLKKLSISVAVIALVLSTVMATPTLAETSYEGKVVKLEGTSTLYYIALDGKRYVYPNEKTFKSWFNDFSDVVTITAEELAQYTLAGNIRYRPGVMLVKIQTDPKVYAISKNGVLRWIKTERLAKRLYGDYWASLIDDIAASFFTNYTVGEDIDEDDDYNADEEVEDNDTVEENRGLKLGHLPAALKAATKRCRAIPAKPKEGIKRAISARICKLKIIDDGGIEVPDETAPVISEIEVETTDATATITWTTDEDAEGAIEYDDESLATASTTETINEGTLVTSHSIELTELIPETTYYFTVKSTDESGNIAVSDEDTFTTEDEEVEEPEDETAPIISNIQVTASSTSFIFTWTTDEESDSAVEYADESLTTASSTDLVTDANLVTSHSLDISLTNLTSSTTYYFIVKSSDESNNEAASTEDTFTTTE